MSERTSSIVMTSRSPLALVTVHSVSDSINRLGAFIQLSGLYAPPSAWTATQPSCLTMRSLIAIGRWAERRPS